MTAMTLILMWGSAVLGFAVGWIVRNGIIELFGSARHEKKSL